MFEGFDEAMLRGAAFAIGGGVATVILGIFGWNVVQFVLAKYGRKKNGNGKSVPAPASAPIPAPTPAPVIDSIGITKIITEEFARFREEFKEEIREERELFKEQLHAEHMFISDVNKRVWSHVQDRTAHAGGP